MSTKTAWLHDGNEIISGVWDEELGDFIPIEDEGDDDPDEIETTEPQLHLVPGLIDIHIHGGFGIDVMSASSDELVELCEKLQLLGIEYWLPTTVTASSDSVSLALDRLPGHRSILGFHLEGPFISTEHPGAQPAEYIQNPDERTAAWDRILDDERLRVITIAPELPGALELISQLSDRGVVVSMGHTDATYDQAIEGFEAGMSHSTHTYNAMRGLHHREAGALGAAMTYPDATAELIYDRVHVSPAAADVLFRTRTLDGEVIGVSDSTMATGLEVGSRITMWNLECEVFEDAVRLVSNGALAGSISSLDMIFENLVEDFGIDTAARCCSWIPRQTLGITEAPKIYLSVDPESGEVLSVFKTKLS